jgi:hypothetical protein
MKSDRHASATAGVGERRDKSLGICNLPRGKAFNDDILLVRRQIFGSRESRGQHAPIEPDDVVERSCDVEALLRDDPDDPAESHDERVQAGIPQQR